MRFPRHCTAFLLFLAVAFQTAIAAGEIIVKDGESMAFLGDSITAEGWEREYGYVRVALEAAGIKVTPVPAGVAGDTSERMLKRLDGILAKKPTWMTLSCGFNDVSPACGWKVGYEDFTKNVTAILDKSRAAGVKVIILTPSLYQDTDPENDTNHKAAAAKAAPPHADMESIRKAAQFHYGKDLDALLDGAVSIKDLR